MPLVITIAVLVFVVVMVVLFCRHSPKCDERTRKIHRLRYFRKLLNGNGGKLSMVSDLDAFGKSEREKLPLADIRKSHTSVIVAPDAVSANELDFRD